MENNLEKTLGLIPSVGLAITMVVGSGLLILPGLAYGQAQDAAIYAWLISAIVSIPLLMVFARLGADLPGAGGIAGFMQASFSRRCGSATEILILGTIPGGAALAITGGKYISALVNGNTWVVGAGTVLILAIGGGVNYFGAKVSGRVQQILAAGLVVMLTVVALLTLLYGDVTRGAGIAPLSRAMTAMPTVALVFFAFVGWELMSFTSEEFKNPKRDFPLMIAISFVTVVALYLLVALTLQLVLPVSHPRLSDAPIAAMLETVFGHTSGQIVSILGILIVVANFISVVWAFSRLAFASAREGLLPPALAKMDPHSKVPRNAIIATIGAFAIASLGYFLNITSQAILFELAGISFFMSYLLAVMAYIKRTPSPEAKIFGSVTLVGVGAVFLFFGLKIVYPVILYIIGYALHAFRHSQNKTEIQ